MQYNPEDLIELFNTCFTRLNTRLAYGDSEPVYIPASDATPYHRIMFAHGFFRSALHECAHWLVAGEQRRQLLDYGYWYEPDGRTAIQQAEFERVEVLPQAYEWILTKACAHPFEVSVDNLSGEASCAKPFKDAVYAKIKSLQAGELPERVEQFRFKLATFYQTEPHFAAMQFSRDMLN